MTARVDACYLSAEQHRAEVAEIAAGAGFDS
jgi:hypothetical protein